MEKVLLRFDEVEFNHSMRELSRAKSVCQNVIDQINEIGAFKMDQAAFVDILQQKGEATARRIQKETEAELNKVGIQSGSIRDAAVKGDLEKYYTVLNAFARPNNAHWPYLSIDPDGKVAISPQAEATLREQLTEYIKTEKGLELYAAHKKMVKAVNEFLAATPGIRPEGIGQCFGEGETARTVGLPSGARLFAYDRLANPPQ